MRQELLNGERVEDGFHNAQYSRKCQRKQKRGDAEQYRISTSERAWRRTSELTYLGGVTDAVAGFLPLKSLMKARVTSMLGSA